MSKKKIDIFKIIILVFLFPISILVFIATLAGFFADGGTILDRIFISFVNPLATILVWLGLFIKIPKKKRKMMWYFIVASVSIAVLISVLIITGAQKGDFLLPLILVLPQILYLIYRYTKRK